eukprot:420552-Pleurochrysis_carterae.AAC.2
MEPGSSLYPKGAYRNSKILFLDVDGVLNKLATCSSGAAIVTPGWPGPLSKPMLQRLKRLLDQTGALIVLSTMWRMRSLGISALLNGFKIVGIPTSKIVGATPFIPGGVRAPEILQWLNSYGPCAAWAAVDDIDLRGQAPREMNGHAVLTFVTSGLTTEAAASIVGCLEPAAVETSKAVLAAKQHSSGRLRCCPLQVTTHSAPQEAVGTQQDSDFSSEESRRRHLPRSQEHPKKQASTNWMLEKPMTALDPAAGSFLSKDEMDARVSRAREVMRSLAALKVADAGTNAVDIREKINQEACASARESYARVRQMSYAKARNSYARARQSYAMLRQTGGRPGELFTVQL